MLLDFWLVKDNLPENTDCFVVLSYAIKDKDSPTLPTKAAIELAYRYWKKNSKAKIIMSTGDNQDLGISNAVVMANYAIKLGIPEEKIIKEEKSKNTYENLVYSLKIVRKYGFKNPTLVCYDLHTRRALASAKRSGWRNFYWLSARSSAETAFGIKGIYTHSRFTIFCYEVLAYIYSRIVKWV